MSQYSARISQLVATCIHFRALAKATKRRLAATARRKKVPIRSLRGTRDGHRLACLTGRVSGALRRLYRLLAVENYEIVQRPAVEVKGNYYPINPTSCEEKTYVHALQNRVYALETGRVPSFEPPQLVRLVVEVPIDPDIPDKQTYKAALGKIEELTSEVSSLEARLKEQANSSMRVRELEAEVAYLKGRPAPPVDESKTLVSLRKELHITRVMLDVSRRNCACHVGTAPTEVEPLDPQVLARRQLEIEARSFPRGRRRGRRR